MNFAKNKQKIETASENTMEILLILSYTLL